MLAGHHGRDQIQQLTLTAKRDGTVTGLKVELLADMGAYLGLVTPGIPLLGAYLYNSIYKFAAYKFVCTNVFTNKTWTDAYRGAGRPEATFAIERIMDALAAELGRDPLDLREQNWIKHEEFPFTTVAGSPTTAGTTRRPRRGPGSCSTTTGCAPNRPSAEAGKDPVQLGIGISTYTEMCGWAPSRLLGELSYVGGGWEHAQIRMLPTGKVEVVVGVSAHGQGHETAFSQIVADRLGVPFEDVEILHGDTQVSPRGLDTYGSRSLAVGGAAVHYAVDKVIEKARRFAAPPPPRGDCRRPRVSSRAPDACSSASKPSHSSASRPGRASPSSTITCDEREQQLRVGAGADEVVLVGFLGRARPARVDDHDLAAALAGSRAGGRACRAR